MQLYLAKNVVNHMTGDVIGTIGQELTEQLLLHFNQYGVHFYTVTIWKPAEDEEDLPFDEDQTPLVINDPSLNMGDPDLSLLDTDDLIF